MLRPIKVLAFLLLTALSGQTAPAAAHDSSRMKQILVLGDSLSDGFRLPRSQAYPALLANRLRRAGLAYEVTNASRSGGTTADGLQRLPAHLKQNVDIFILELGINDAFFGRPISEIRANLQAMIDRVRERNPAVHVVIAGMELPNYSADDYVSDFTKMYADLAAENDAALVPSLLAGVAGDPNLNLPDRLHPNAAGQEVLARNVWQVLEPIAREVASDSQTAHLNR